MQVAINYPKLINKAIEQTYYYYPVKRFTGGVDENKVLRIVEFSNGMKSQQVISTKDAHYDICARYKSGAEHVESLRNYPQLINRFACAC